MNRYRIFGIAAIAVLLFLVFYFQMDKQSVSDQETTASSTVEQAVKDTDQDAVPSGIDVKIALVALEDNGKSGKAIGCNDSAVLVLQEITPYTQGTLKAALTRLLSLKEPFYGESGLYNAIAASSLTLDEVAIENEVAVIRISGQTVLNGVCDTPRVIAQIEETALQFDTVTSVQIFLNGEPVADALSQM